MTKKQVMDVIGDPVELLRKGEEDEMQVDARTITTIEEHRGDTLMERQGQRMRSSASTGFPLFLRFQDEILTVYGTGEESSPSQGTRKRLRIIKIPE